MNIHINKETFELLNKSALISLEVGSSTYGLSDENSDKDFLTIYAPFKNERNSFWTSHHQFQYKDLENNIDYNFVSIFTFLRNLINGDSTLNIEFSHSKLLIGTPLEFLYNCRHFFYNFNILRSYNGLAKRDLKHLHKEKTERDKNKKIIHAYRGNLFANQILNNEFEVKISDEHLDIIKGFRLLDHNGREAKIIELNNELDEFRLKINKVHNDKQIVKFMDIEYQKFFDSQLFNFVDSDYYKSKIQEYIDLTEVYKANEFGVIY